MKSLFLVLVVVCQAAAFAPNFPLNQGSPSSLYSLRIRRHINAQPLFRSSIHRQPHPFGLLRSTCKAESTPGVSAWHYMWFLGVLPSLSLVFPLLIDAAQNNAIPEERRTLIILLLILKRVYLYLLAITTVDIASRRSVGVAEGLGSRMQALNEEILDGILPQQSEQQKEDSTLVKEALDNVDSGTQALLLPATLAALLASSFFFLGIQSLPPPEAAQDVEGLGKLLGPVLQSIGSSLPILSSAACAILFTRAEFKAFQTAIQRDVFKENSLNSSGKSSKALFFNGTAADGVQIANTGHSFLKENAAMVASAAAVGMCYLGPTAYVWPIRNVVNSCLAVTAARALQLPKLQYVVLALGLLVGYDVVSVFGTGSLVAPAAAAAAAAAAGDGGAGASMSVMESVARAKLAGGMWQPGLLTLVVQGRVSDALGLGDVVLPSMLVGWAYREDQKQRAQEESNEGKLPWMGLYSRSALAGYAFGCFFCEIFNTGGGQPALLFLVPPMLTITLSAAAAKKQLGKLWKG